MTTKGAHVPPDEDDVVRRRGEDREDREETKPPRREPRDDVESQVAEPPPGWSNSSDTTPPVFYQTPGIDMSQPGFSNNGPAATGATAGSPGAWTPANSDPPNKFTSMNAITASPATAWTTGQYVVLGDGSFAHWGGAAWTSGKA